MSLITVTAAPFYPVSRAEAKLWIRESGTDQDAIVDMLIAAMTSYAENLTHRAFVQRSLELDLESFYCDEDGDGDIDLPFPPLISVDYVKYIDTGGVLQTLASDQYDVDSNAQPGKIQPAYQCYWPSIRTWSVNPVRVGFTCGYAPTGSPTGEEVNYQAPIPAELKLWMKARIATLYENREQLVADNNIEIPRHFADGLLDSLTVGTRLF